VSAAPEPAQAVAIEARGLTKVYPVYARPQDRLKQMLWRGRRRFFREFPAVRHVDLRVERSETIGLVGRNGSGKSTLLRMICGTLARTAGELVVNGRVAPILSIGTGFNPEFTGLENVLTNAAILGMSEREIRDRLESIAAFADIGDFFDQPVKTYSAGMHSRLAFAVAIHCEPEILVIDEILAVGDEAFNRKCFSRIEELKRTGCTVLFASHSPNLIVELCDRALLLDGGERLLTGDPKTVIARYHRLLYASPREAPAIREEILRLDRGEEVPGRSAAPRAGGTPPASRPPRPAARPTAPAPAADTGRFDARLQPESTVEYECKGARIRDARVLDENGRQVNVLRPGRRYDCAYEVEFLEDAFAVRFGMMVKLPTGFEIGGQTSHPPRRGLDHVAAGSVVRVRFPFEARLAPGVYFLNAGVLGLRHGVLEYLHRVLDAAIFRIEPEAVGRATGVVDLTGDRPPAIESVTEPGATSRPPGRLGTGPG
jgi:homopolymeric O-antigen transport system ATP-binding protein